MALSAGLIVMPGATIPSIRSSAAGSRTTSAAVELARELLHGAGTDERRGDGRVIEDEGDRELDQRDAGLLCELRELHDGIELALVKGFARSRRSGSRPAREEAGCPLSLRQRPTASRR